MFELIFGTVNVVPVDLCLVFKVVIIIRLFLGIFYSEAIVLILLSTTVLNDS